MINRITRGVVATFIAPGMGEPIPGAMMSFTNQDREYHVGAQFIGAPPMYRPGEGIDGPLAANDFYQPRPVILVCHPEPFASLKGKLREGSGSRGTEMLRFAQHDNT